MVKKLAGLLYHAVLKLRLSQGATRTAVREELDGLAARVGLLAGRIERTFGEVPSDLQVELDTIEEGLDELVLGLLMETSYTARVLDELDAQLEQELPMELVRAETIAYQDLGATLQYVLDTPEMELATGSEPMLWAKLESLKLLVHELRHDIRPAGIEFVPPPDPEPVVELEPELEVISLEQLAAEETLAWTEINDAIVRALDEDDPELSEPEQWEHGLQFESELNRALGILFDGLVRLDQLIPDGSREDGALDKLWDEVLEFRDDLDELEAGVGFAHLARAERSLA